MLYYLANSPIYQVFCLSAAILAGLIFVIHQSAKRVYRLCTRNKPPRPSGRWYR